MTIRERVSNLRGNERREPDWATVLNTMYRSEPPKKLRDYNISTQPVFTVGLIADVSDMDYSRVNQASARLGDWGLADLKEHEREEGETILSVELTDDGFSVAHERQLSNQQNRINHTLAVFTLALVILSAIDILSPGEKLRGVVVSILLIATVIYYYRNL